MSRVWFLILALVLAPVLGSVNHAQPTAMAEMTLDGHCPDHHASSVPAPPASHAPDACAQACAVLGSGLMPPLAMAMSVSGLPQAMTSPPEISPDRLSWPPPLKPPRA